MPYPYRSQSGLGSIHASLVLS